VYEYTWCHINVSDAYRDAVASNSDGNSSLPGEDRSVNEDSNNDSASEEDANNLPSPYGQLLQSLNSHSQDHIATRKKRRLLNGSSQPVHRSVKLSYAEVKVPNDHGLTGDMDGMEEVDEPEAEDEFEHAEHDDRITGDDQEEDDMPEENLTDPFESHFANPNSEVLSSRLKAIKDQKWTSQSTITSQGLKHQYSVPSSNTGGAHDVSSMRAFESLKLKRRLIATGQNVWSGLETTDRELASPIFSYQDVLFGSRRVDNASRLRDLVVLHALNHVFKTRDRVIKNSSRLAQDDTGDTSELRDQGFTRPKVLFILPTRQACVRFTNSMVKLCEPEQQENKSRFLEGFDQGYDDSWEDKPFDFRELFGGNDDDMFRIGLKFTRKTLKFFSAFYNSDIILASPLGLRTAIETGGSKDGEKGHDVDFLSSIEMVIVDHANALLMQNWQHVEHIFSQLNLLPKESHGCDFSRVRHWYLDGESKHIRQTIVTTDFITPDIHSIYTKSMLNFAGKSRFTPVYRGAMLDVPASVGVTATQTFIRLNAPTPSSDADVRFLHFTSSILPSLLKSKLGKGTLIFVSSYLEFVRLRNHLSTSPTTASLSFGAISEYTPVRDVARTRSHFRTGRHSVLLYSERAHHFRRYKLKGVERVIFYSLPENPIFWSEVAESLMPDFAQRTDRSRGSVRALFSRWDVLKLERIVGTSRVRKMVNEKAGDTFEFN
jgi:U3 small nucleolar RNA-associated protein 25